MKAGVALALVGVSGVFLGTNVFSDSYWLGSGIIFGPVFLVAIFLIFLGGVMRAVTAKKEKESRDKGG
jgi:hypothetical protein